MSRVFIYYRIFSLSLFREAVLVYEDLFERHPEKIGYVEGKLKRRRTPAVFDRAYGLPGYTELLDEISLPYLFFFSDLFQPVFHNPHYI